MKSRIEKQKGSVDKIQSKDVWSDACEGTILVSYMM